jgi:DNA modification methylase
MENCVLCTDCETGINSLLDASVRLAVFSPPYAQQRSGLYDGVSESEYPSWMASVFSALRPKMKPDGSIFMNIRPHLRRGELSDYVLKTRLAIRELGYIECEELIWHKPDAPPLGSIKRPRRVWESILWYSLSRQPYCDLKAGGSSSSRIGFAGSPRFGLDVLHSGQVWSVESGVSRVTDLLIAHIGTLPRGVMHPAMYPTSLPSQLINVYSEANDLVLDPFCGSGQTLIAAQNLKRKYIGIDLNQEYVDLSLERLRKNAEELPPN